VQGVYDRVFTLVALPGHPDGAGSTIHFFFQKTSGFYRGDLWCKTCHVVMWVQAHIRTWSWGGVFQTLGGYEQFAHSKWQQFANNISRIIPYSDPYTVRSVYV
jgi:hypothetical protein